MAENTPQPIGFVTSIKGSATAISVDGISRVLVIGDAVYSDETLITGDMSAMSVGFVDGSHLELGRDSTALLDNEVFNPEEFAYETATAPMEAVQQAILAGEDPTQILAAAAAGGEVGSEGGHDFVQIDLTGQQTTPTSGYDTTGPSVEIPESQERYEFVEEEAPSVSVADDALTIPEGGQLMTGNVLANDAMGPGAVIAAPGTYTGSLGGLLELFADGHFIYRSPQSVDHADNLPDQEAFSYTATNTAGDELTATLRVSITDLGPAADADSNNVEEGQSVSGTVVDSGDDFSFDGMGTPPVINPGVYTGNYGTLVLSSSGDYVYTAFDGLDHSQGELVDQFTYTIVDSDGSSSANTLSIQVTDGGPMALDDAGSIEEGNLLSVDALSGVLANDAHQGDAPIQVITTGTIPGQYGQLTLNADGSYSYQANDGLDHTQAPLIDSFSYTIRDNDGSLSSAVLRIEVTDGGPVALDDAGIIEEGYLLSVNALNGVLANDLSQGDAPIEVITTGTLPGLYGQLTLNADGSYSYQANDGLDHTQAPLIDSFDYSIRDADGSEVSAVLRIQVTDGGPIALADSAETARGEPVDISVLANDDAQGDAPISVVSATDPANGSVVINLDGTITYTPDPGFVGTDTFMYTINDADFSPATAPVTVNVEGYPPNILDGVLITNTNQETQIARLTFTELDPSTREPTGNVYTTLLTLEYEGQQQQQTVTEFLLDVGFDIDPNKPHDVSLQWVSGPKIQITYMEMEGVEVVGQTEHFALEYDPSQNSAHTLLAQVQPSLGLEDGRLLIDTYTDPSMVGDGGDNVITGTDGDDVIAGLAGNDDLSGGAGNDALYGGAGDDTLDGGEGNDTATYFDSSDPVTADLMAGTVTATGHDAQSDTLSNIENVIGSESKEGDTLLGDEGSNILVGLSGDDTLEGRGGDDVLIGGFGEDTVNGGAGNDIIDGNSDADQLTGGAGADVFLYRHMGDAGDTITDFNPAEGDSINLTRVLPDFDANNLQNYLQLVPNGDHTELWVNPDGAGVPGDTGSYTLMVTLLDYQTTQSIDDLIDDGTVVVDVL